MGARNLFGSNRTVYFVDPRRLSIGQSDISTLNMNVACDYENFQLEGQRCEKLIDHFPMEHNGIWYFETENEALEFVREQMGI